jgi:hypothetical protein
VTVEACDGGCGGAWFDNFELRKFDEPHEAEGARLLNLKRDDAVTIDRSKQRPCPKCEDVIMLRHFLSVKEEVEVDECPSCGGIWLDFGELARLRSQYKTDEERRKAADEYFNEVFGKELVAMKAENNAKVGKVRKLANLFRFICPSYYLPGRQKWGAF